MSFESSLAKLVESTSFTKDCSIGDLKITMRVLNFSEETKLSRLIDEMSDDEDYSALNDWKKLVVSMAIYKLDGEKIPDIIERGEDKIERNLYLKEFLDDLPSKITDTVFDFYTDLKEESEKSLEEEIKYNWFKDPETRKKEEEEQRKKEADAREKELERLSKLSGDETDSEESQVDEVETKLEESEDINEDDIELEKID